MQLPITELEAELEFAALGLESGAPEQMAGGVAFCTQPNCDGVLRRRGRRSVCPICGTRYDGSGGASIAGNVGPPQGHTKGARGSTHDTHTKRRAGGREKKDRRRQWESELGEASFEAAMEQAAEAMDAADAVSQIRAAWRSLPPEIKQEIQRRARLMWQMRGSYLGQFLTALNGLFAQNPAGWQQALVGNRAAATQQLALLAGQMARLPAKGAPVQQGLGDAQVRQFHRRQQARGFVPGRNRQTGLYRELELEIDQASRELEAEPFFTKVTPIPGIGNKEGHEILTRIAMRGLPLSAAERSAVELGVIRPDRGGRSYWNFPRAALGSLKAAAQPAHSLRPTPSTTVAEALRLVRARFADLHRRAMSSTNRATALEWLGEALHLLQDSFSSAHVDRVSGKGRIRHIRAFFIRFGWPPLSRAPQEHNAPSDSRDDVYLNGALRTEALAAVQASRAFLVMALRHLSAPRSPLNQGELQAFMNQYLSS